jgi:hypothetical protein
MGRFGHPRKRRKEKRKQDCFFWWKCATIDMILKAGT